jgi:parallel beta-helix repeat protein
MAQRPFLPRLRGATLAATLFLLLPAASAAGADAVLHVDRSNPACSDSGPGTEAQPLCSIKAAASRVSAGETVQVAAGTYSETVTVSKSGTSSAPIVFTTAPGARVTLSGGASGFAVSGATWVTINGFTVTSVSNYGISISNSSRITVSGNEVSYAGQPVSGQTRAGIRLSAVTDSVVSGNSSHHNSDHGILLTSGSQRNEVMRNLTFRNAEQYHRAAAGIRLYSSPGNTVAGNISHHNEDSGIECYTGSNNTLLYNNVTYDNGDHGIDNYQTTGQRVIANSVYRNVTAGINVEGSSTGATVANNISVDNGIRSPRTHSNIRVEAGSTSGTTMDGDLVQLTTADTLLIWNSTSYSSLAAFQAATGQETRGLQADPKWKSPSTGDFHLTAGSPAIDSANSGVSGQPSTDVEGFARFDDPDTANTGLGPRAYDDRGAYEFGGVFGPPPDSPPVASLTVTSPSPQSLDVTADASASTDVDDTPIASYSFDFGDVTAVVGPQPQATALHTYAAPGTYTVTVTVTDTAGLSSVATATVEVGAPDPPPFGNLVGNAGFETDLSGWNTSGSGSNISLTRVSGGRSGSWAAKLTNTGTSASTATLNDSPDWAKPSSAGTYTGTLWVRGDTAGATLRLRFREYNGSTLVGSVITTATLTSSWQQVAASYSPQAPGSSTVDFNAYVSSAAPGTAFYADDAAIFLN